MGNRGGCFHRADKTLMPTHWRTQQWIICVLDFKGRHREIMSPGRYTELFFLDEATALAAGHRPCFECQRVRATAFRDALIRSGALHDGGRAGDMDRLIAMDVQRRLRGEDEADIVSASDLPDGSMFEKHGRAFLKWKGKACAWSFEGYGPAEPLLDRVVRLTPTATLSALAAGYTPDVHRSLSS